MKTNFFVFKGIKLRISFEGYFKNRANKLIQLENKFYDFKKA